MHINDFTKEEDKEKASRIYKKSIEGKTKENLLKKAYIHKSGDIIYGSVSTSLVERY